MATNILDAGKLERINTLVDAGALNTELSRNPTFGRYQVVPADTAGQNTGPVTPPEPVSLPTYGISKENFGVMRHVEPIHDHFITARANLDVLRKFVTEAPGTGRPLLERVEAYLKKHLKERYATLLTEQGVPVSSAEPLASRFFSTKLPRLGDTGEIRKDEITVGKTASVGVTTFTHNAHSALFATGTVMTDDIRTMEALRDAMVKVRREHQHQLEKRQAELAELDIRIAGEYTKLVGLEARRCGTLDDYAVAQHLLAEHWQEIEQAYADRARVIGSSLGLYYVRVRETPLSRSLPDPLDLRYGAADDLVPGCPGLVTPLTGELMPFMALLLDIPAADWALLSGLSGHLPGRVSLEEMILKRRQNLAIKLSKPAAPLAGNPTLGILLQIHQAMVQTIAARPFAMTALRDMQQQGHKILALEDLLASPIPALRDPAGQLHQRLTAAAGCLLSRLRAVKPSLRLAWAVLAENDRLQVEKPELWPHLAEAEADGFNAVRTLLELVGWWFRQLDDNASGDSRTAMRNFIRACLLLSAGDNPRQLLQGQLLSLPTRFRPGELLRLNLNREPAAGNLLHLLDDRQQVIALVRVEDHDSNGTLASIATVINPNSSLTLAMRVTGQPG